MAFGQAFATAFLNGLTGQIQERRREAKEERKRRERIAETAGLQQYLKRQTNFNKYMNIAKRIQKLADPDGTNDAVKQNIAKLVTNPEFLIGANTFIDNFSKKYPNVKITPARINGLISNLDLVTPEGGLDLEEAAKKAAGLVVQNTNLDQEKKDPSAMENNIFMSLLGVGAEQREIEKLKSDKVGQGFSTYDLYKMAMGGDYSPIDQATGSLDYSYFPMPFTASRENLIRQNTKATTTGALSGMAQVLNERINKKDPTFKDIYTGTATKIGDAYSELMLMVQDYENQRDSLDSIYAAKSIAQNVLLQGELDPYMKASVLGKKTKIAVLQQLLDNPEAINRFGEGPIKEQGRLLGVNLRKTGQVDTQDDKDDDELIDKQNKNMNKSDTDDDTDDGTDAKLSKEYLEDKKSLINMRNPLQKGSDMMEVIDPSTNEKIMVQNPDATKSMLDNFVEDYGQDMLPLTISEFKGAGRGDRVRPRTNDAMAKVWDQAWGKYYRPDGRRK
tara:strand:+ start:1950 stop:3458 length:1509 start_codon:yes stop_codon:yes gene_type:complete